jgi:hypothetical protein
MLLLFSFFFIVAVVVVSVVDVEDLIVFAAKDVVDVKANS